MSYEGLWEIVIMDNWMDIFSFCEELIEECVKYATEEQGPQMAPPMAAKADNCKQGPQWCMRAKLLFRKNSKIERKN